MLKKVLPIMFLILCSSSFCFNGWEGIKNEKFTIFYKSQNEYAAKKLMQELNEVSPVAERTTGNKLKKVYFVIDDFGNVVNGYADPMLSDSIHVYTYSPDADALALSENWYKTVGVHEYTHMLQMKNIKKTPRYNQIIFGNLSFPNAIFPKWIIEGIAVYTESQFSKYSGRLNDGYYDAYLMARLQEGNKVNINENVIPTSDFPVDNIYLYGGLFFRYLSNTYGEESFEKFFTTKSKGGSPDSVAKTVFGKKLSELWNDWQEFETKRASSFKQDGDRISDLNYYAAGTTIYNGYIYFTRDFIDVTSPSTTNTRHGIYRKNISTNKEELFFEYTSTIYPTLIFKDNFLYFSTVNFNKGFHNSSQNGMGANKIIYKMDLTTKKYSEILNSNIRCFSIDSNNNIFYTTDIKDLFGSAVYKYDTQTKSTIKVAESKMLINELIEYNGKFFVSAKQENSNFGIFEFNISDSSFIKIADTPFLEGQISIYDNKLFFISNNNSQYRSYYFDLTTNELFSLTESGYSTYPAYSKENNTLYYIGINSNGNNLYKKEFLPQKSTFSDYSQSVSTSDFKDLHFERSSYSENILSILKPSVRGFGFSSQKNSSYFFISLLGADKVSDIPFYNLTLKYDSSQKHKFDFDLTLKNNLLLPVRNSLTINRDSISTEFLYPILRNSKPGIESISGSMIFKSENSFNRKSITPKLYCDIKYPSFTLSTNIETPFESKIFSTSEKNSLGVLSSVSAEKLFSKSYIHADFKSYYNPDNSLTEEHFIPKVRGYSDYFENNDSIYTSLNYSTTLLKLNKGSFKLGISPKNLGLTIFADSAFQRKDINNRQLSSGFELSLPTKALYGLMDITPSLLVSFPEDKKPFTTFSINSVF